MAKNPLDELLEGLFGKNPTGRQPTNDFGGRQSAKPFDFGGRSLMKKVDKAVHVSVIQKDPGHWHSVCTMCNDETELGAECTKRTMQAEFCGSTRKEAFDKATKWAEKNEAAVFSSPFWKAEEKVKAEEKDLEPPPSYPEPSAPIPTSDVGPQS